MYDFYSESRKLEGIFKASNLEPRCRDLNNETPRILDSVHKFTDAVEALGSGEGADATPGHDDSRFSPAAVAILRTELAFYAVKRIQLCKWIQFQPTAVSDDNMESSLIGVVAPSSDCIGATRVLCALMLVANKCEHTRIPLLKQLVNADIHSALSEMATELNSVLLQPHQPAALMKAYEIHFEEIMCVAQCVYHIVVLCTLSDMSASSRQLLSRFWVGSVQHKTPIALINLVSTRRLSDISIAAHQFGIILSAHKTVTRADYCELPERSKALEALCRSHAVQQFGVQMLQGLLSSDHYSKIETESCKMMIEYLIRVYEGGNEETHVLSDSLISSEGGVLVESLRQFAAGKLGSDWGWSIDLTYPISWLFSLAWKQCLSARARCNLEVLVSVSRQAGALLALRRLPLEQQAWGVRRARAAGILQGMMQLEPSIDLSKGSSDAISINDILQILCSRGLYSSLATHEAGRSIMMPPLKMSAGEILATFECCLRNIQGPRYIYAQNIGMDMVNYLPNEKMQLERPSDCALGFLTSLRKVLAPDLVDQGDSSNMATMQCAVLLALVTDSFADTFPAPGPGFLSAILLQFLPLFIRCPADSNRHCRPMPTWCIIRSAAAVGDPEACCEAAAACNAAGVLDALMSHPLEYQSLLSATFAIKDTGSMISAQQETINNFKSNHFMLGNQKAWDYQVLMVADPLTRLLDQAYSAVRPRALLLAVCGVESITSGNASLELPSTNALNEEAVRLMTWLTVCGNDTSDVYPRVQALVCQLMAEVRALQPVVPPSLESLRIKAPIPGCYNPRCINLSGVSESLMECKMCSGCNKAQFCSVACQRQHWPAHRKACREAASQ